MWARAAAGLDEAGTLEITVDGPLAGVLRYTVDASATVADGAIVYVCAGGRAYEGASGGFSALPGRWRCGADALVAGFRNNGQPLDSWNDDVPADQGIQERVALAEDGSWLWTYEATSESYGGRVTARVSLDPESGRIGGASRTDPLGRTTYALRYGAQFPAIEPP